MNKHTPGPWHFVFGRAYDRFDVYCSTSEGTIAQNVRLNDAHLITAAPKMLTALEALLHRWDMQQDMDTKAGEALFEQARLVIAEAKGEQT